MSTTIRISNHLYKRLESLAVGFDTPANVIERLLDNQGLAPLPENTKSLKDKPSLHFFPDEEKFKELLIHKKKAYVKIEMQNGQVQIEEWSAKRFSEDSNLRGNIWSGYLRGWKEKGIVKAVFAVDQDELM